MKRKVKGCFLLTGEILKAYMRTKPLQIALNYAGIEVDNSINHIIKNIEDEIKTGDSALAVVIEGIKKSFQSNEYKVMIKNINEMYNTNITCVDIYNNLSVLYGKL